MSLLMAGSSCTVMTTFSPMSGSFLLTLSFSFGLTAWMGICSDSPTVILRPSTSLRTRHPHGCCPHLLERGRVARLRTALRFVGRVLRVAEQRVGVALPDVREAPGGRFVPGEHLGEERRLAADWDGALLRGFLGQLHLERRALHLERGRGAVAVLVGGGNGRGAGLAIPRVEHLRPRILGVLRTAAPGPLVSARPFRRLRGQTRRCPRNRRGSWRP